MELKKMSAIMVDSFVINYFFDWPGSVSMYLRQRKIQLQSLSGLTLR